MKIEIDSHFAPSYFSLTENHKDCYIAHERIKSVLRSRSALFVKNKIKSALPSRSGLFVIS